MITHLWSAFLFLAGFFCFSIGETAAGAVFIAAPTIVSSIEVNRKEAIKNREVLERTEALFQALYQSRQVAGPGGRNSGRKATSGGS